MPRVVEYFRQSLKAALSRKINNGDFRKSRVRPSTKFEVRRPSRSEDMAYLVHVSCLPTTTVSQLFEPQLQKVVIFTYPGLHFLFALGRPCGNHAKRCINGGFPSEHRHPVWYGKTIMVWKIWRIQCMSAVYLLQQFPSYSNHNCKKSSFLRTPGFIFCLPWDDPVAITQNVA